MSLSRETARLQPMEEALAAIANAAPIGSTWRHLRSRSNYRIAGYCLQEATLRPCVLYRALAGGVQWSRPASEFLDGRFVQIGEAP